MLNITGTYTDLYQLTMGEVYFKKNQHDQIAVFDYFFRKLPFDGGFAVFAGLETFIQVLTELRFDAEDLDYLKSQGFSADFLEYLKDFRFTGNIYSMKEGELVFPKEPIVRVEASIIEAQIIETLLLNILNFQTLIATKAARMKLQAKEREVIDFGLRRAQGTGGHFASRAAVIGGVEATSNVRAGRDFDIPVSGTMAHSFIQSYEDELSAFRDYAKAHPDKSVLLVDTYSTLKSGIPNAIRVGKELESIGHKLVGIRLDSGDLAYLSRKARKMLDDAGLAYVKIAASNQLDEYLIKSLLDQEAPIDIFGVGTRLITGQPDAALDGVYKLAHFKDQPRIKISETISKITLPHKKQVFRMFDQNGNFAGADAVSLHDEKDPDIMFHPSDPFKSVSLLNFEQEALLERVVEKGKMVSRQPTLFEIQQYSKDRIKLLPIEYKRFSYPHIYKVGLSSRLKEERDRIFQDHKS